MKEKHIILTLIALFLASSLQAQTTVIGDNGSGCRCPSGGTGTVAIGTTVTFQSWAAANFPGTMRKDKPAPKIVRPQFKLVSRHPFCRRWGCIPYVPGWSGSPYAGLPQSHCYRCGMITNHADKDRCPSLADYQEPLSTRFMDKMLMKLFPGKS